MSAIFEQLFGKEAQSSDSDLGDPSLKQGQRFDYMQHEIISGVLPALPLMAQTTGPGLGSIVEPFEDTDGKDQAPCYTTCEEVPCGGGCYTGCSPSMGKAGGCPPGVSKNWCTCNIDGTKCPNTLCTKQQESSITDKYDLVDDLNQAEMQNLQIYTDQYEALINQLMSLNTIAASPATYENQNAAASAEDLKNALTAVNKKIMVLINELVVRIDVTHNVNNKAKGDAQTHAANLNNLLERKRSLDTLLTSRATLTGHLADRRQELDSTYLHYLVWFISAITLAAMAFKKLSKN